MNRYLVVGIHPWNREIFESTLQHYPGKWFFTDDPEELTLEFVEFIDPKYIFFLHWSYIIPYCITSRFECVIFHPSHLPYGRGGSPIQNLIDKGFTETKLTAFQATEQMDAGPIYASRTLSLEDSAEIIFYREMLLAADIIKYIISKKPTPKPQEGEAVYFKRRKPEQSDITGADNLDKLYDLIRMMDAPDYPKAFLDCGRYRIEFSKACLDGNKIRAEVIIHYRGE